MVEKKLMSFQVTTSTYERVAALAKATGVCRSEFIRRAIDVAEAHLGEIRAQGEPEDGRSKWHH